MCGDFGVFGTYARVASSTIMVDSMEFVLGLVRSLGSGNSPHSTLP